MNRLLKRSHYINRAGNYDLSLWQRLCSKTDVPFNPPPSLTIGTRGANAAWHPIKLPANRFNNMIYQHQTTNTPNESDREEDGGAGAGGTRTIIYNYWKWVGTSETEKRRRGGSERNRRWKYEYDNCYRSEDRLIFPRVKWLTMILIIIFIYKSPKKSRKINREGERQTWRKAQYLWYAC